MILQHHWSLGKCQLKSQETTRYLLEWQQIKDKQTKRPWQYPGLLWRHAPGPHTLLVGTAASTATLQNSLAVSYKVKETLNERPSHPIPVYLPKLSENSRLCKNRYINVSSGYIPSCQKNWK